MPELVALTRPVPDCIARCELSHLARAPIDVARARRQHALYEQALARLRCRVERLPAADENPDGVFVEDAAVVVDELAVITRPGAASRRGETASVERALARYRAVAHIESPGTLDGGDVLRVGRDLYVGRSARSDAAGIARLAALLGPLGYTVTAVDLRGCLHLKTAVTRVGERLLLVQPDWVDPAAFPGCETIAVDPDEPFAANALWLGGNAVIAAAAFPRTAARLAARGLDVHPVPADELAKAEAGVTCCSIVLGLTG